MLRTLRIRYDPVQDRLVLGLVLVTGDGEHIYALALTRRLWMLFRAKLQRMVDLSAGAPAELTPGARQSLSAAYHQAMAAQVPVRTEAPPQAERPEPDLVLDVRCGRRRSDARWSLGFVRQGHPELTLVLTDKTLHAMFDALLRRESATDWGLTELPAHCKQPLAQPGVLH